ncbi:hypothetical protein MBLNU457_2032t1 [Dothideomycetes sp. NU457]
MPNSRNPIPSLLFLASLTHLSYAQSSTPSPTTSAAATSEAAAEAKIHLHHHIMILAHGWCMFVAFAILFPIGATLLHLLGGRTAHLAWLHGSWQLFSLSLAIAGAGLGGWLVVNEGGDLIRGNGHPLIGIIVLVALTLQPLSGALAHHLFAASRNKTVVHVIHRWTGRTFLVLGAVNGGLGLRLQQIAGKQNGYILVPYVVVVVGVFVCWGGVVGWGVRKIEGGKGMESGSASETEVVGEMVGGKEGVLAHERSLR